MSQVTGVRAEIAVAACQLGLPDPAEVARDLIIDVDGLRTWFEVASDIRWSLSKGAAQLSDAVPLLAAGWSSPTPQLRVVNQRTAGITSHDVISRQVDAVALAEVTLRRNRALAADALDRADREVCSTGWPPGQELLRWADFAGTYPAVVAILQRLDIDLASLQTDNVSALRTLAVALRDDPRDAVERVAGLEPTGPPPGPCPPGSAPVDQINLDHLQSDLQSSDWSTVQMARGVQQALDKARAATGTAQLLVYQSASFTSQGRAAIGIGDIASADTVVSIAPGLLNAPVKISEGIDDAVSVQNEARRQAPGQRTSVISWYGYDIPGSAAVGVPVNSFATVSNLAASTNDDNAKAGGGQLVDDLQKFRELAPPDARFVAIGFSMGSTTVSEAAAQGAPLDDLVLLGSPGAGTDVNSAADYPAVPPGHTFVTSFDHDPVTQPISDWVGSLAQAATSGARLSSFGPDPASRDFGAQRIDAHSNNLDLDVEIPCPAGGPGGWLGAQIANTFANLESHHLQSNYLSGASLQAVTAVVVGHYTDVPLTAGR